jgi:hypothetical protein
LPFEKKVDYPFILNLMWKKSKLIRFGSTYSNNHVFGFFFEQSSPLLELSYNQDRGKLNYPNERFVGLIEFVVDIMIEILRSLPKEKTELERAAFFRNHPVYKQVQG